MRFHRDLRTGSATTKEIRIRVAREERSRRRRWLKRPPGIVWKSDDERRSLARPITPFSLTVFPPPPPTFSHSLSLFGSCDRTLRFAKCRSAHPLWQKFCPAFSFSRGIRDKYQSLRLPLDPPWPFACHVFFSPFACSPYASAVCSSADWLE